ncbi:MAG: hypothetical protein QGF33_10870 [Alphaproteobacteria bacterium]|nr:hypothetical protein [Alphaproteobacteria bacterium]
METGFWRVGGMISVLCWRRAAAVVILTREGLGFPAVALLASPTRVGVDAVQLLLAIRQCGSE